MCGFTLSSVGRGFLLPLLYLSLPSLSLFVSLMLFFSVIYKFFCSSLPVPFHSSLPFLFAIVLKICLSVLYSSLNWSYSSSLIPSSLLSSSLLFTFPFLAFLLLSSPLSASSYHPSPVKSTLFLLTLGIRNVSAFP